MTRNPADMTALAARAKTKVKASARGWTMLSHHEIEALAFVADLFLEDAALSAPTPGKPEPDVISTL